MTPGDASPEGPVDAPPEALGGAPGEAAGDQAAAEAFEQALAGGGSLDDPTSAGTGSGPNFGSDAKNQNKSALAKAVETQIENAIEDIGGNTEGAAFGGLGNLGPGGTEEGPDPIDIGLGIPEFGLPEFFQPIFVPPPDDIPPPPPPPTAASTPAWRRASSTSWPWSTPSSTTTTSPSPSRAATVAAPHPAGMTKRLGISPFAGKMTPPDDAKYRGDRR